MKVLRSSLTHSSLVSRNPNSMSLFYQVSRPQKSISRVEQRLNWVLGEINLKKVNLKPDKATELMLAMGLPFQLKAGTIGNL
jgi:hypothetical protein